MSTDYRKHIGGTDAPAIIGVHPQKKPIDVYARIVEGKKTEQNQAMRRGLLLEPVVREMYRDETSAKLLGPSRVFHPRHDWAGASLDDRTEEKVIEYKTAALRMLHEWGEGDDVPTHYLVQCQWYMMITGLPAADLVVLLGGDELRIHPLTADLELHSLLLEQCERFWVDYITKKTPPPVDGSWSCSEWLKARYPADKGPTLQADPSDEMLAREFFEAQRAKKDAEAAEYTARNKLIARIGEAAGIVGDGWSITYKQTKGRATLDVDALCAAHGITAEQRAKFEKRNPFRSFRPTDRSGR